MKKMLICFLFVISLVKSLLASDFLIDPVYSSVGFEVENLQISKVNGNFRDFKGSVGFNNTDKSFTSMKAVIKVASVETNNTGRNAHILQEDFFNEVKYPTITFVMNKFVKIKADKGIVSGRLCISGVCKDIKLESQFLGIADVKEGENAGQRRMGFSLDGVIKRSEFDFAPNTSTLKIGDKIRLNINVEAYQVSKN